MTKSQGISRRQFLTIAAGTAGAELQLSRVGGEFSWWRCGGQNYSLSDTASVPVSAMLRATLLWQAAIFKKLVNGSTGRIGLHNVIFRRAGDAVFIGPVVDNGLDVAKVIMWRRRWD